MLAPAAHCTKPRLQSKPNMSAHNPIEPKYLLAIFALHQGAFTTFASVSHQRSNQNDGATNDNLMTQSCVHESYVLLQIR